MDSSIVFLAGGALSTTIVVSTALSRRSALNNLKSQCEIEPSTERTHEIGDVVLRYKAGDLAMRARRVRIISRATRVENGWS